MANEIVVRVNPAATAARLRVAMMRMVRRLKRETGGAESPSAISALAAIRRLGEPTLSELAEAEGISRPSITAQTASLEARGLVVREGSADDRRVVHIRLTPAGLQALERSATERTAWLARRLDRLSSDELRMLETASGILERLLEQEAP